MYDKLRKVHEETEDGFRGSASLWIGAKVPADADYEFEYDNKITLPFRLDFEYRSWGVKGVMVTMSETIKVVARKVFYDDKGDEVKEERVEFDVDLSQIRMNWVEGGIYAPGELSLNLDEQGNVDYKKSSIEFYYIRPE